MKNLNIKDISKLLDNSATSNISSNISIKIIKEEDNISVISDKSIISDKSSDNISNVLKSIVRTESGDKYKPIIRIDSFSNDNKNSTATPILKYKNTGTISSNKRASISNNNIISYINNDDNVSDINYQDTTSPIIKHTDTDPFSRTNSADYNDKYNMDDDDDEIDKKDPLIKKILKYKEKLNKNLFILSVKYDRICYKYNTISLTIMILSTISTFIEATRLTLTEYLRNNENNLSIDTDIFTLSINILMLVLGTVITILSSIVRFKNYREIMEKLKNYQNIIVKYKILYDKQIDIIKTFKSNNKDIDDITFRDLNNKLREYNKEVNENINLIEDIRNDDKVKLQQFKHIFDIKLDKMKQVRNLEMLKNKNEAEIKKNILNNKKEIEMLKIKNKKNLKCDRLKYNNIDKYTELNNKYDISDTDSRKDNKKSGGSIITTTNFDVISTI